MSMSTPLQVMPQDDSKPDLSKEPLPTGGDHNIHTVLHKLHIDEGEWSLDALTTHLPASLRIAPTSNMKYVPAFFHDHQYHCLLQIPHH